MADWRNSGIVVKKGTVTRGSNFRIKSGSKTKTYGGGSKEVAVTLINPNEEYTYINSLGKRETVSTMGSVVSVAKSTTGSVITINREETKNTTPSSSPSTSGSTNTPSTPPSVPIQNVGVILEGLKLKERQEAYRRAEVPAGYNKQETITKNDTVSKAFEQYKSKYSTPKPASYVTAENKRSGLSYTSDKLSQQSLTKGRGVKELYEVGSAGVGFAKGFLQTVNPVNIPENIMGGIEFVTNPNKAVSQTSKSFMTNPSGTVGEIGGSLAGGYVQGKIFSVGANYVKAKGIIGSAKGKTGFTTEQTSKLSSLEDGGLKVDVKSAPIESAQFTRTAVRSQGEVMQTKQAVLKLGKESSSSPRSNGLLRFDYKENLKVYEQSSKGLKEALTGSKALNLEGTGSKLYTNKGFELDFGSDLVRFSAGEEGLVPRGTVTGNTNSIGSLTKTGSVSVIEFGSVKPTNPTSSAVVKSLYSQSKLYGSSLPKGRVSGTLTNNAGLDFETFLRNKDWSIVWTSEPIPARVVTGGKVGFTGDVITPNRFSALGTTQGVVVDVNTNDFSPPMFQEGGSYYQKTILVEKPKTIVDLGAFDSLKGANGLSGKTGLDGVSNVRSGGSATLYGGRGNNLFYTWEGVSTGSSSSLGGLGGTSAGINSKIGIIGVSGTSSGTSNRSGGKSILDNKSVSKGVTDTISDNIIDTQPVVDVTTRTDTISKTDSISKTSSLMSSISATNTKLANKINMVQENSIRPPTKPNNLKFSLNNNNNEGERFSLFTKIKGKDTLLGIFGNKGKGLGVAKGVVDTTSRATFFGETSTGGSVDFGTVSGFTRKEKKGKIRYVEPSKFRINTLGEKLQISAKGRQSKKKGGLFF